MAEKYFTIKLTITRLFDSNFRSRIEQSPLGASEGPGSNFILSEDDFQQLSRENIAADPEAVGRKLFDKAFTERVREKYQTCIAAATQQGAKIRIAIVLLDKNLIPLPWEYLHDGANFLTKQNYSIIRVFDHLWEKDAPFGPFQKLLVAVANPTSPDYHLFDAEKHIEELKAQLDSIMLQHKILFPATKVSLERELREGKFDALYFLGHGRYFSPTGGQLILEGENRESDPLNADTLAVWLSNGLDRNTTRFVYLNSCSTAVTAAETDIDNIFSGTAQRLIRDGKVAAVVAMQTDIGQRVALKIAVGFFEELKRGASAEESLMLARSRDDVSSSWGIPVLYTYLSGPENFERNRIATLLNVQMGASRFRFFLPSFKKGVLCADAERATVTFAPPGIYTYPSDTYPKKDIEAAWHIINLVSKVATTSEIKLSKTDDSAEADDTHYSHWFLFGSKSNEIVNSFVNEYRPEFKFHYETPDYPDKWVLEDTIYGKRYEIPPPDTAGDRPYEKTTDFGVIEKLFDQGNERTYFLFSGLGDRATKGCAQYFLNNWEKLLKKFGNGKFTVIIKFPGGMGGGTPRLINRATGEVES